MLSGSVFFAQEAKPCEACNLRLGEKSVDSASVRCEGCVCIEEIWVNILKYPRRSKRTGKDISEMGDERWGGGWFVVRDVLRLRL